MKSLDADFKKFTLKFLRPMGTSRGTLSERDIYVLSLEDKKVEKGIGLGECAPLSGLSVDAKPELEQKLRDVCEAIRDGVSLSEFDLNGWPAVRFALETALIDLEKGGRRILFDTDFVRRQQPIPINGLIVMSEPDEMFEQVESKIRDGFWCIKIKIGALQFDAECELLERLRHHYPPDQIELRLDANGAFSVDSALDKLYRLSKFRVHSIEQPIRPDQRKELAELCSRSPIPIALDEELIGITTLRDKESLLENVMPHYIVLKPTLLGGLKASMEWVTIGNRLNIGSWVTSALESNIGLNALTQWTSSMPVTMPQGLGTGQLFTANFESPLNVSNGQLTYDIRRPWPVLQTLDELKLAVT